MRISDWSSDVCSSDLHLKIGVIIVEGRNICSKPTIEERRFQADFVAPNIFREEGTPVAQLESARFEPAGCRRINHDVVGNVVIDPDFRSPAGPGWSGIAGIDLVSLRPDPVRAVGEEKHRGGKGW